MKENSIYNYGFFIVEGAARSFHIKDEVEITSWFAFENQFAGSLQSYQGEPLRETIHFIEDSQCLKIDIQQLKDRQKKSLLVSQLMIALIEEHAIFLEDRLRYLLHNPGLERYRYILKVEPQIIQRVSVNYLASYLGVTRETLSRLRKKAIL